MVCIGLTGDIISEKIKVVFVDLQFYIERPWQQIMMTRAARATHTETLLPDVVDKFYPRVSFI